MTQENHIVYCMCAYYDYVDAHVRHLTAEAVRARGGDVVEDLCGLAVEKSDRLGQWTGRDNLTIIACHERAVRCLLAFGGAELGKTGVEFINIRTEQGLDEVAKLLGLEFGADSAEVAQKPPGPVPWFPVIDYSRCVGCRKCLDFCLFGTYGLSEAGTVEVQKPLACKVNCPACARVCPEGAIIFAKHDKAPINGGPGENAERPVDYQQLIGSGIHEKLRARSAGRFSVDAPQKRDLQTVRRMLDIPAEVLADMSPEQIKEAQRRFRRAADDDVDKRGEQ